MGITSILCIYGMATFHPKSAFQTEIISNIFIAVQGSNGSTWYGDRPRGGDIMGGPEMVYLWLGTHGEEPQIGVTFQTLGWYTGSYGAKFLLLSQVNYFHTL